MRGFKRHLVIPDTQIHKDTPVHFLTAIARYIADRNDPIDHLHLTGDWYDMPSLNSWNKKGSLETEGKRLQDDRDAGYAALELFFSELMALGVSIDSVAVTEGNHEQRLDRMLAEDPRMIGLIDRESFYGWEDFGIDAHPMCKPYYRDGLTYCHFFDLNANGATTGSRAGQPNAHTQVRRVQGSSIAGHKQGYDCAVLTHPYSPHWCRETFAVIAGSCYLHNEGYRGPTDGYERRGIVLINEINGLGMGVPMFVSLSYLMEKYG